ncbi:MAG: hypothetical protein GX409_11725 [candidate division Zixibacteria bacterium]|jgi:hypothetical protein|nr:hypothetical protein [candidate division Zixibacteria bacterium]
MKYLIGLIISVYVCCACERVASQNTGAGWNMNSSPHEYYGGRTDEFIRYCSWELFPKFQERRFGLTPLFGEANSFELWADSINHRYLVSVEIAERGWEVSRRQSIPLLYKKYVDEYKLEALVEIFYRGMIKPILAKKYRIRIIGKTSYQLLKNDPDYSRLYVPYSERQGIEKQALKSLAAQVSADIFKLIN